MGGKKRLRRTFLLLPYCQYQPAVEDAPKGEP